jgi:hypothetical protein
MSQGALIDLLVDEFALSPQANHRKARPPGSVPACAQHRSLAA